MEAGGRAGSCIFGEFVAAQWPFADFLMSPESRNRIFQTTNFPYFVPSTSPWVRNVFFHTEHTPGQFWVKMAIALVAAILTVRLECPGGMDAADSPMKKEFRRRLFLAAVILLGAATRARARGQPGRFLRGRRRALSSLRDRANAAGDSWRG